MKYQYIFACGLHLNKYKKRKIHTNNALTHTYNTHIHALIQRTNILLPGNKHRHVVLETCKGYS